jgi:bifunctional non-homologous end joining protein LigD
MADQLSLDLAVELPRLPSVIRPMLPRAAAEPFDSTDHLFEPSWGGLRILAFVEDRSVDGRGSDSPVVRLVDQGGRDVTMFLPELATLPGRLTVTSVVLDGEIVVVDRMGRGDRLALAARMRGNPGPPVAFLVFDLLYRDGRPLFNVPLDRRREQLRRVLRPGDEAIAVPSIAGDGRALYAAVVEAGIAGVMGRVRRSPYLPGVRSRLWQFVARRDDLAGGLAIAGATGDSGVAGGIDGITPAPEARPGAEPRTDEAARPNAPMLALIRRLPLGDPED